jgi:putative membrane protein
MVVSQSGEYVEGQIIAGLLIGGLLSLAVVDLFWDDSLWYFMGLSFVSVFLLTWLVAYLPALKRLFSSSKRMTGQVKEKALAAFYEKGLYKTRDETGVLFFISLYERKVWVLADRGIYKKISPASLQSHAKAIAQGIKNGTACEALCSEIERIAEVLVEHFPVKSDDVNELPDEVMVG